MPSVLPVPVLRRQAWGPRVIQIQVPEASGPRLEAGNGTTETEREAAEAEMRRRGLAAMALTGAMFVGLGTATGGLAAPRGRRGRGAAWGAAGGLAAAGVWLGVVYLIMPKHENNNGAG